MSRRYFGTDGIRGTVGEAPITADFILKLGWAMGRVLSPDRRPADAPEVSSGTAAQGGDRQGYAHLGL